MMDSDNDDIVCPKGNLALPDPMRPRASSSSDPGGGEMRGVVGKFIDMELQRF